MNTQISTQVSPMRALVRQSFTTDNYIRIERLSADLRAEMSPGELEAILETGIRRKIKEVMDREPRVNLPRMTASCPAHLAIPFGGSEYVYVSADKATFSDVNVWYKHQARKAAGSVAGFKKNRAFYMEVQSLRPAGTADASLVAATLRGA